MQLEISIIETLIIAFIILFTGYFLNSKVKFLRNNNIPEPVVGGIVFSILSAILYFYFEISFQFDMAFKTPLMTIFFTTVGLGASFVLLIKGGPKVVMFLGVLTFKSGIMA